MKEKKPIGLIIVIIVVALLGGAGIWYAISTISSPKNVMLTHFAKLSSNLLETTENAMSPVSKIINSNETSTLESSVQVALPMEMGKVKLDFDCINNRTDKKMQYLVKAFMDDEELLTLEGLQDASRLNFRFTETMQQYYYIASEYFDLFSIVDISDYKIFSDLLIETLKKDIDDKDITVENVTVKLGEKEEKTKKYTYVLTPERVKKFVSDYSTAVKENDQAIDTLIKLTKKTKEEMIEELDRFVASFNELEEAYNINLSTYVRGMNEVVMTELSEDDNVLQYRKYDKTSEFYLRVTVEDIEEESSVEEYVLTIVEDTNKYDITLKCNNEVLLTGTYTHNIDGNDKLDLVVPIDGSEFKVSLTSTTKEIVANEKYLETITGTLTIVEEGVSIDVGLEIVTTLSKGGDITLDVTDSKDLENLTEEENQKLLEQIYTLPIFELYFQGE